MIATSLCCAHEDTAAFSSFCDRRSFMLMNLSLYVSRFTHISWSPLGFPLPLRFIHMIAFSPQLSPSGLHWKVSSFSSHLRNFLQHVWPVRAVTVDAKTYSSRRSGTVLWKPYIVHAPRDVGRLWGDGLFVWILFRVAGFGMLKGNDVFRVAAARFSLKPADGEFLSDDPFLYFTGHGRDGERILPFARSGESGRDGSGA
ncbi:b8 [miniopterid betaherpesvirus 1]|uniref:B8 n=1 Tax=miniopterid betaherpesvirus 1 TaxID=3070189 RepID=I3VPY9_9BETA|nr:b8 [miniopterid betaherpesvirus 1]AFK83833.1 b8 [miniopterid betaherpesvirus 1]